MEWVSNGFSYVLKGDPNLQGCLSRSAVNVAEICFKILLVRLRRVRFYLRLVTPFKDSGAVRPKRRG